MREIEIQTEFITLGQLLKLADFIGSGGEVKSFLLETTIKVNDVHDNRRGRKLYPGDILAVEKLEPVRVVAAVGIPEKGQSPTD